MYYCKKEPDHWEEDFCQYGKSTISTNDLI
jgi:hypothetical protein